MRWTRMRITKSASLKTPRLPTDDTRSAETPLIDKALVGSWYWHRSVEHWWTSVSSEWSWSWVVRIQPTTSQTQPMHLSLKVLELWLADEPWMCVSSAYKCGDSSWRCVSKLWSGVYRTNSRGPALSPAEHRTSNAQFLTLSSHGVPRRYWDWPRWYHWNHWWTYHWCQSWFLAAARSTTSDAANTSKRFKSATSPRSTARKISYNMRSTAVSVGWPSRNPSCWDGRKSVTSDTPPTDEQRGVPEASVAPTG